MEKIISKTATQVIAEHWDDGSLPVDPAYIAAQMGIAVLADPKLVASGHYEPKGFNDGPLITYNPTEPPVRQRFTIAHELAHFVLNHGVRDRDTPDNFTMAVHDQKEVVANKFAVCLLIPKSFVDAIIQVNMVRSLPKLAKIFGVSKAAMSYRLKELGYDVEK